MRSEDKKSSKHGKCRFLKNSLALTVNDTVDTGGANDIIRGAEFFDITF